ncbi:MAG: hypothetical protein RL591_1241 [Planctomycetota bacterium]|jgi:SAM-dependent methyltransferase
MITDFALVAAPCANDHNLPVLESRIVANPPDPFQSAKAPSSPGIPDVPEVPEVPDVPGFRPDRCAAYLAGTEGSPPRPQLLRAIELVRNMRSAARVAMEPEPTSTCAKPPVALDIGCGPGRELVSLLDAGFDVDAFDPYPEMLERARRAIAVVALTSSRVRLAVGTLEDHAAALERDRYDLVHAGFVLPFVRTAAFDRCWNAVVTSLRNGGVFVGQFFGPNDEFIRTSKLGEMSSHTRDELDRLFADWDVVEREEVDRQGAVGRGVPKWWHVHHIVAKRRATRVGR